MSLLHPVTVLPLYWTVGVDDRGEPVFKKHL
jgi:hypothetical protein